MESGLGAAHSEEEVSLARTFAAHPAYTVMVALALAAIMASSHALAHWAMETECPMVSEGRHAR